ncbi:MAG TPA: hypothetical protein PLE77_09080 [Kiritimatiellia bacterium]|nr:hypothetical protein [Kiritimatiellia bacterium]
MTRWFESNRSLFEREREALAIHQPLMTLDVLHPGAKINALVTLKSDAAVAHGSYCIEVPGTARHRDYSIAVITRDDYPKSMPFVYCDDPKLPIGNIDRHIMKDGQACLGVYAELRQRWKEASGITTFLKDIVAPFLAWQIYYDAYGHPPPWGQRAHAVAGILEFYADLLALPATPEVEGFMQLLARKNEPKGHEPCPCASGERLRDCHKDLVRSARAKVAWQDVAVDIEHLRKNPLQKSQA